MPRRTEFYEEDDDGGYLAGYQPEDFVIQPERWLDVQHAKQQVQPDTKVKPRSARVISLLDRAAQDLTLAAQASPRSIEGKAAAAQIRRIQADQRRLRQAARTGERERPRLRRLDEITEED